MIEFDKNGHALSTGMVTIHHHTHSGEYVMTSTDYIAKGTGLPAHSTLTPPPEIGPNEVAVYENGVWSKKADHRGTRLYHRVTGEVTSQREPGPIDEATWSLTPTNASLRRDVPGEIEWVLREKALGEIIGETLSGDMVAYTKLLLDIANGVDTTTTALPARPSTLYKTRSAS